MTAGRINPVLTQNMTQYACYFSFSVLTTEIVASLYHPRITRDTNWLFVDVWTYVREDYKVRITIINCMFSRRFVNASLSWWCVRQRNIVWTRSRVFYVHDITVILRYFFEETIEKKKVLMEISKISDAKYNVVIYCHHLCKIDTDVVSTNRNKIDQEFVLSFLKIRWLRRKESSISSSG